MIIDKLVLSKSGVRYLSRTGSFDKDLEVIDILVRRTINGDFSNETSLLIGIDQEKHIKLAKLKNNNTNRMIVMNHLRKTMYSAYIKDVYEEFIEYLKGIMVEMVINAKTDPARVAGEQKVTFTLKQILELINNGTVAEGVIDSLFQSLEKERSTLELIKKICAKTGLSLEKTKIERATAYLNIRHFLIHSDGILSEEFRMQNEFIRCDEKGKVKLDFELISSFRDSIKELVYEFEKKAQEKGLLISNTP